MHDISPRTPDTLTVGGAAFTPASKDTPKRLLRAWVRAIIEAAPDGSTTVGDIKAQLWEERAEDLLALGAFFHTYQDQVPWCVTELRNAGIVRRPRKGDARGAVQLA